MEFAQVKEKLGSTGFTVPWLGRQLYDAIREADASCVLELGTAHGAGTSYMAAAVAANGPGQVTSVDRYHFANPAPEETLGKLGLTEIVELVRIEYSSYTWWLRDLIRERSDADGNCEPLYDFCFLDGAHDWHIDGLAVILVERLLRPGAWLVLDDMDWTYHSGTVPEPPNLSKVERDSYQIGEVFDILLRPHPAFSEFRVVDGKVGWARKDPRRTRTLRLETTTHRSDILTKRLRMAARRAYRRFP